MPSVGPMEIVIVLALALIVFGPKRLPELGNSLGRSIREFKSSVANNGAIGEHALPDEGDEVPVEVGSAAASADDQRENSS